MNKLAYLVVLLILAGGAWLLFTDTSEESTEDGTNTEHTEGEMEEEKMDDDASSEEESDERFEVGTDVGMEFPEGEAETQAKIVAVTGKNFEFSTKEIRVKEGDTVIITFESTQGSHDWVVDEFGAATQVVRPGEETTVTFVADKKGTYEYYCSVGSHRQAGMVGNLIVE